MLKDLNKVQNFNYENLIISGPIIFQNLKKFQKTQEMFFKKKIHMHLLLPTRYVTLIELVKQLAFSLKSIKWKLIVRPYPTTKLRS